MFSCWWIVLLLFVSCVLVVYLLVTVRVSSRVHGCLHACVGTLQFFMEIRLDRLTFSIAFSSVMEGNTHHKYWR